MTVSRIAKRKNKCSTGLLRFILLIFALRGAAFGFFYGFTIEVNSDAYASAPPILQADATTIGADNRPIAEKGFLCVDKNQGRLNNILIQLLVLLNAGQTINRTVLVTENMASAFDFYDFDSFSLNFQAGKSPSSFRPMLVDRSIPKCYNGTSIQKGGASIPQRLRQFDNHTMGQKIATVQSKSSWYFLGRPKPSFYVDFFSVLRPIKTIATKVDRFLQTTFQGKPFVAVHLRNLEGACKIMTESLELCCPTRDVVVNVLQRKGMSTSMPIFVANDMQCPDDVINGYKSHGDILGFNEDCQGSECAVLDFEICVRAALFVGTLASSADMNIREMRSERMKLPGSTSVLSLREETWKIENVTALTRNWIPGTFKWIKDCENVRNNRYPCV